MGQQPVRRSVVRGALWSVPVLSVAAAAPAMATSTCPAITATETLVSRTSDRITLTNKAIPNSVTIPSGTTLTWQFANVSSTAATITFSVTGATSAISTFTVAVGDTATITMTTNTTWTPGATGPVITYSNGSAALAAWNYRSRLTLSIYPAPISSCPNTSACASIIGSAPSVVCPTAPAPAAAARQAPMPAPAGSTTPADPGPDRQLPPGWVPPN